MTWDYQNSSITCKCTDINELIVANSFDFAPNTINFATVFLRFSPKSQAAVLGAVLSVFVIYAIAVVYLRRRDRNDQLVVRYRPVPCAKLRIIVD